MTETSGGAIATYGEGVKWLVGISASAVAGGFLHVKEIEEQSLVFRVLIAGAMLLFSISIWGGINYLLWLNALGGHKERIRENREELLRASVIDGEKAELQDGIDRSKARIRLSEKTMPSWHRLYTFTFVGGLMIATVSICFALIYRAPMNAVQNRSEEKSTNQVQPNPAPRFHLAYSAVHQTAHGKEAHTFLLDDQTGSLWQMICVGKDDEVAFRPVQGVGLLNASK
jgi:hypothetical protein